MNDLDVLKEALAKVATVDQPHNWVNLHGPFGDRISRLIQRIEEYEAQLKAVEDLASRPSKDSWVCLQPNVFDLCWNIARSTRAVLAKWRTNDPR